MPRDTKVGLLRRTLDVSSYSRSELARLARLFHEERHEAGTVLCTEGEMGTKAYLLVEGTVSIVRRGRRIATYGPGEFVGEMALLDNAPRSATVTATSPLRVLAVDRDGFPSALADQAVADEITSGLRARTRVRRRSISGATPPSANPRAWSRLREAARRERRRRRRRRLIALTVSLLMLTALAGAGIRTLANRSTPVGVDEAVTRFRDAAAAPAQPPPAVTATEPAAGQVASATAPTLTVSDPTAPQETQPERDSVETHVPSVVSGPAPGVYIYDTEGFEEVTIFGGSRHDYPEQTTMTVSLTGCGFDLRWDALEERWDSFSLCIDGSGIAVDRYLSYHEFYEQSDLREFACVRGTFFRPPSDEPGAAEVGRCETHDGKARVTTTVVGIETVSVGGVEIKALRMHHKEEMTGSTRGTRTGDSWWALDSRTLLRWDARVDGESQTPAGYTRYTEEFSLHLTSLTPRN